MVETFDQLGAGAPIGRGYLVPLVMLIIGAVFLAVAVAWHWGGSRDRSARAKLEGFREGVQLQTVASQQQLEMMYADRDRERQAHQQNAQNLADIVRQQNQALLFVMQQWSAYVRLERLQYLASLVRGGWREYAALNAPDGVKIICFYRYVQNSQQPEIMQKRADEMEEAEWRALDEMTETYDAYGLLPAPAGAGYN